MIQNNYLEYLEIWLKGLYSEIKFWENEVMIESGFYHDEVVTRMIRNTSFRLEDDLEGMDGKIKFLDVGSGPFSRCGFKSEKYNIQAIAVDPLAYAYNALKAKYGMYNPIDLRSGFVELLDQQFEEGEFDVVHMSNSLDHTFDALFGVYQLLHICRIGGKVILMHHENEAENENYEGLHQWNLSVHNDENSFVIWRNNERYDICKMFKDVADIEIYPDIKESESEWIYNKIIMVKKKNIKIPINRYSRLIFEGIYKYLLMMLMDENGRRNRLGLQNDFSRHVREKIAEFRIIPEVFYERMNKQGYRKVDIYGAGKIGRDLYMLCMESGIEVRTLIDRNSIKVGFLPVIAFENYEQEKDVDVVISTIEDVLEKLKSKSNKVIGVRALLEEMILS